MLNEFRDAAIAGDTATIERLLATGVDIDSRDRYGQTALMLAALHGRDGAVRLLLSRGADLDVTAKYGLSALMLAVINRHDKIAMRLVDAGADIRSRGSGAPGFAGKTARQLAEDNGQPELARYLARAEEAGPPGA